jgi:restriction system protein
MEKRLRFTLQEREFEPQSKSSRALMFIAANRYNAFVSVWEYRDGVDDIDQIRSDLEAVVCRYCQTSLVNPHIDRGYTHAVDQNTSEVVEVKCCAVCGWWVIERNTSWNPASCEPGTTDHFSFGASAVLRKLDLQDQSLPLSELRQYLAARYDDRFNIHPSALEKVVASIYRDFGYYAVAIGRSGDGGIDVVLEESDGTRIGVQVKRHRERIEAEPIRAFVGALYLKDILSGVFVTTSEFTRGASDTATLAADRGMPIELVDAARFYAELGLAQIASGELIAERISDYARSHMVLLSYTPGSRLRLR